MRQHWIYVLAVAGCTLGGFLQAPAAGKDQPPAGLTFERDIRPIFKAYCLDCHGGGEAVQGKLDLRLRRFLARGGGSGPSIVAGKPEASLLLKRIKSGVMPPTPKKVPAEQIAIVERWIAEGAPAGRVEPLSLPPGVDITAQERAYWFFQPLRRPRAPAWTQADRVRTPIDAFIAQRLREKGLAFSPDADKPTILRRVALILTGLPPSPEEARQFLSDESPDAYEKMVDRYLASPHYGERWGRHWLDVVGYADSEGNGSDDNPRPYAYKYRDYVIRSLNADKPWNQFITGQLAGDELVPKPWKDLKPEQLDKLVATGYLRTAADPTASGGDSAEGGNQVMIDTVKIVSSSLLGLTVGCAQCHDHRYDPIPQSDYYRLRAVIEPVLDPAHWRRPGERLVSLYTDEQRAKAAAIEAEAQKLQATHSARTAEFITTALEKELLKYPAEVRDAYRTAYRTPVAKRTPDQKKIMDSNPSLNITPGVLYQYDQKAADQLTAEQGRINAKRAEKPIEDFVSVADERAGVMPATRVFYRGDYRQPKQEVMPGDLTIAAQDGGRLELPKQVENAESSGRRLAWARHLTNGKHPLFGRVIVNRIWLHHFGRGIVDTPGDFGKLGVLPTHPELLDWLADEFVQQRWSLKSMHRLILTSTVFRQASTRTAEKTRLDTDGSLYSRYPVRRLEAEVLRDSMLVASGRLDRAQGGPAIGVSEDTVGQVVVAGDSARRSVYLQVRRSKPISFLTAFDAPVTVLNCEKRLTTTSAPQALMLMNSDFILKQAEQFAARVLKDAPKELPARLSLAWQIAYQRTIAPAELEQALRFINRRREQLTASLGAEKAEAGAFTSLCQQLLSSNEYLYVD